jgi:hypothetical protein
MNLRVAGQLVNTCSPAEKGAEPPFLRKAAQSRQTAPKNVGTVFLSSPDCRKKRPLPRFQAS